MENNLELELILKEINKGLKFGEQFILASQCPEEKVIPTGSLGLDIALGSGGWRMGRFTEIYGPESVGKSFLSLLSIKEAQKMFPDKIAVYYDTEHSFNAQMAENLGLDLNRVLVNKQNSAKFIFGSMIKMLESGKVSIVVVDSIASILTDTEEDKQENVEKTPIGSLARVLSQAMKKVTPVLAKSDTVVLLLNQIREGGVVYGPKEMETPGGRALRHGVDVRVQLNFAVASDKKKKSDDDEKISFTPRSSTRAVYYDESGKVIGARIHAVVRKNKRGPMFNWAVYDAYWQKGICREAEIIDLATMYGIIAVTNGWYSYNGQRFAHGREQAIKKLTDDKELSTELERLILESAGIKRKVGEVDGEN